MERYYTDPDYRKAVLLRNRFRYHNYYKHNYKVPRYENLIKEDQKKEYIEKLRLKYYEEMLASQKEIEDEEKKIIDWIEKKKEYHRIYYISKKKEELDKMIETNNLPVYKKRGRKPLKTTIEYKIEIVNAPRVVDFSK